MKKRLIFTLLYEDGHFVLSRNFRTQKVGNIRWLEKNYNFSKVAFFIDELIVLNVSQQSLDYSEFADTVGAVAEGCFAPIAAGGGIRSVQDAELLFAAGADKIVLNRALYEDRPLVEELVDRYGRQAIVASLDLVKKNGDYQLVSHKASTAQDWSKVARLLDAGLVGEIYANSVERDGTGQGMDQDIGATLRSKLHIAVPLILAGGAGKPEHLLATLGDPGVGAAATANLLNFIGDGLRLTRESLLSGGIDMAVWSVPVPPRIS